MDVFICKVCENGFCGVSQAISHVLSCLLSSGLTNKSKCRWQESAQNAGINA